MLKPSYSELIRILNEDMGVDNKITSRYSIVIAAAKRARQIVGGEVPSVSAKTDKAVSLAIGELEKGYIKIAPPRDEDFLLPSTSTGALPSVIDETAFGVEVFEEEAAEAEPYEEFEYEGFDEYEEKAVDEDYYDDEDYEDS